VGELLEYRVFPDNFTVVLVRYTGPYLPEGYEELYVVDWGYTPLETWRTRVEHQDLPFWEYLREADPEKPEWRVVGVYPDYESAKRRFDYIVSVHKPKPGVKVVEVAPGVFVEVPVEEGKPPEEAPPEAPPEEAAEEEAPPEAAPPGKPKPAVPTSIWLGLGLLLASLS